MTHTSTIAPLDGIRGLAALLVAFSHMGNIGHFYEITGTGQHGVMLFFVLSGFLMSWLYGEGEGSTDWRVYAIRRVMRVYPLYFAVILLAFLAHQSGLSFIYGPVDFFLFLDLAFLQADYLIFWTIPVEMKFYLVFPIFAFIVSLFARGWFRVGGYAAVLLFCLSINVLEERTALVYGIAFFGFGMLAGEIHRQLTIRYANADWLRWVANAGLVAGLIGLFLTLPPATQWTGWVNPMWYGPLIFGSIYAGLILSAANAGPVLASLFGNPAARYLGHISFAIYLLHLPVINTVRHFGLSGAPAFVIDLVGILLIASLFHFAIERPARNLGYRWSKRQRAAKSALA